MQGDAAALPFRDPSSGSVALLSALYHPPGPRPAVAEAQRVVPADGLVAVAPPSRRGSPEVADALEPGGLTFHASSRPTSGPSASTTSRSRRGTPAFDAAAPRRLEIDGVHQRW